MVYIMSIDRGTYGSKMSAISFLQPQQQQQQQQQQFPGLSGRVCLRMHAVARQRESDGICGKAVSIFNVLVRD